MSDDAKVSMVLYWDLLPKEKLTLEEIEEGVLKVLSDHDISARPMWICETDVKRRVVRLCLPASPETEPEPRVIFELPSSELATLSHDKLLRRINESMGQR